ncbi:hypothetical protein vBAbaMD22_78 [Acinetobacter phage vB_AbaM_D22]|nr:hypothetical protein vBAbaMD22_78 [Acinetobacter phage vB_AbaM_D22]
MPKFKISVTRVHAEELIVEAVDFEHAQEIGSNYEDEMESTRENHVESEWPVVKVSDDTPVNYKPKAKYLAMSKWK